MQGSDFCMVVCVFVDKTFFGAVLLLFFRSALRLLAEASLCPSLNVSWILEGAEKLLDYGEYYCGLKYVSLYVGALSPCTIRIV